MEKLLGHIQSAIGYSVDRGELLCKNKKMICLIKFLVVYGRPVLSSTRYFPPSRDEDRLEIRARIIFD